jgi:DNA polymerase (family 10)
LRVVPKRSFGAALIYFTGSKAHNIALRALGLKKGMKINEYGVFKGQRWLCGRSEEDVYARVGLKLIAPELRENSGEIEAAQNDALPKLIRLEDIRGDLHVHTNASDGEATIDAMVEAAAARGYDYVAISDHTKHVGIVHGLDPTRLRRQMAAIDGLNARTRGFHVLKAAEVDILPDGSLGIDEGILAELDLVVAAVHTSFELNAVAQTERIIRAMDRPCVNIIAHPTGRLLGARDAIALDMKRLMKAAIERDCFLEVNAQPTRLDLSDLHCRLAKELGLRLAISTDAHTVETLNFMSFGVDQARRGWIEAEDVINTRNVVALQTLLRRRRLHHS